MESKLGNAFWLKDEKLGIAFLLKEYQLQYHNSFKWKHISSFSIFIKRNYKYHNSFKWKHISFSTAMEMQYLEQHHLMVAFWNY